MIRFVPCHSTKSCPLLFSQLQADFTSQQRDSATELSALALRSREQLSLLDLEVKQLGREAWRQHADIQDRLSAKLEARDEFIEELQSQVSEARAAVCCEQEAFVRAEAEAAQRISLLEERLEEAREGRHRALEEAEAVAGKASDLTRQLDQWRKRCAELERRRFDEGEAQASELRALKEASERVCLEMAAKVEVGDVDAEQFSTS